MMNWQPGSLLVLHMAVIELINSQPGSLLVNDMTVSELINWKPGSLLVNHMTVIECTSALSKMFICGSIPRAGLSHSVASFARNNCSMVPRSRTLELNFSRISEWRWSTCLLPLPITR